MKTEIIKINPQNIDYEQLKYAAEAIKAGGLVAFPTETVYGLGANALNENAVKAIFAAKGRPSDNPLIVHIAKITHLNRLIRVIPENAELIMNNFWPGPLTLVFERSQIVPDIITAGLDTVAVRVPSNPIAMSLIELSSVPIAAPSANTSGKPSPTTAEHVIEDLYGKVDVIIDGGGCQVGVESTVLDMTIKPNMILRPGGITKEQLSMYMDEVQLDVGLILKSENAIPKAPGMKYTHYSPKAEVIVIRGNAKVLSQKIKELYSAYENTGKKAGVMITNIENKLEYRSMNSIDISGGLEETASGLFKALRKFDEMEMDIILAEAVVNEGIGLAVMNRLLKAAGYHIIEA